MATIKSILGKMFVNDKQIVVLDDTAENGGIESGSNANGSYIKYPDGTLVCRKQLTLNYANASDMTREWTYPIPFVGDIPVVNVTGTPNWNPIVRTYSPVVRVYGVALSVTWVAANNSNATNVSGDILEVHATAIGRWK